MRAPRLALDDLQAPAMVVGEDGEVRAWNREMHTLAGLARSARLSCEDLFDEENLEEFRNTVRMVSGTTDKVMAGLNLKPAGTGLRFIMTVVPFRRGDDRGGVLALFNRGEGTTSIYTDFLTKLPNRQEAAIRLRYEWNRSIRSGSMFSLSLADIDHFKRVNDTLGHEAGDQVLIHVANQLREQIRGSDWCARWGGEEFLLFLNDVSATEAEFVINRLRERLARTPPVHNDRPIPVTLSFGLVSKGSAYKSFKDMINDADVLLYESKQAGRNRVTLFETQGSPVAWQKKEVEDVIRREVLHPFYRRVSRADGSVLGLEVEPSLEGMDAVQTRRMWQSADGLNLLCDLEMQLMTQILRQREKVPRDAGIEIMVPVSAKLAGDPNFGEMLDRVVPRDGARCVFLFEGEASLSESAKREMDSLVGRGFRLAIRDTEINKIPLRMLSEHDISYLLVKLDSSLRGIGSVHESRRPIIRGLLESIRQSGTQIVAVKQAAGHEVSGEYAGLIGASLYRGDDPVSLGEALSA